MCLIDKKQFRIAEKDIPIFKVVYKKKYSPFQRTLLWNINNVESGNCCRSTNYFSGCISYWFDKGFYHACLSKEKAKDIIEMSNYQKKEDYSIITGYIPEGTRYAQDNLGNICAKRMILNL